MTIDEIMHRLQVLKDGGYIWLYASRGFYRYRDSELQCARMSCHQDPRLFLLHVDLERVSWDKSARTVQTLVQNFQSQDVVFPPTQVSTPTRNMRSIEL